VRETRGLRATHHLSGAEQRERGEGRGRVARCEGQTCWSIAAASSALIRSSPSDIRLPMTPSSPPLPVREVVAVETGQIKVISNPTLVIKTCGSLTKMSTFYLNNDLPSL